MGEQGEDADEMARSALRAVSAEQWRALEQLVDAFLDADGSDHASRSGT